MHFYFVLVKASFQLEDDLNNYRNIITSQEIELQQLRAEFDLLKSDLALRLELTSELKAEVQNWEEKFHRAEEEKLGAILKLNMAYENQTGLTDQVGKEVLLFIVHSLQSITGPNGMCSFVVNSALRGEGSINTAAADIKMSAD